MAMLNNQSRAENWLCEKPNKNMVAKKKINTEQNPLLYLFAFFLYQSFMSSRFIETKKHIKLVESPYFPVARGRITE